MCGTEDPLPPSGDSRSGHRTRGKAGPKGDKGEAGESCTCPTFESAVQAIRDELSNFQIRPRDCLDVKYNNLEAESGLYQIYPPGHHPNGMQVLCDQDTDGGGWLVFQNRFDGSVDFEQNWNEYVNGFGQLSQSGEFWLGLEKVHQLTFYGKHELRIDISDFEDETRYALYSSFSLSKGDDYSLMFDVYSGTAGGALNKQKFSTKDRDQDDWGKNCALEFHGAWWYTACHSSNLNGLYLSGATDQYATGMTWSPWRGQHYALKTSQMKFRPVYN